MKKAISAATSAALLGSLLATVVAPAAFAQTATVTGGGAINPGGPASAAVTIAVSEDAVADWGAGGTSTIVLTDAAGGAFIYFTGTPTVTASGGPAPFACSAALATTTLANDSLTVSCTGGTNTRLDSFSITGLKLKATTNAAIGAVHANWSGSLALGSTSATASGTLNNDESAGTDVTFEYTLDPGSPDFQNTVGSLPSKVTIGGPTPETVTASGVVANTSFVATTGAAHPADAAVTQTVLANRLPTLATVGDTTSISTCGTPIGVRQGINNQPACDVTVDFGKAGFVAKSSTITLTIASAGEQFSALPTVTMSDGATLVLGSGVLSFERKSITYTVTTASTTNNDKATFSAIKLDVAGTAAQGSTVDVNLGVSPTVAIVGNPASIAQVGSALVGAASVPTVLIGYNDQPTGTFSFRETAPGTLTTDVGGGYDIFGLCLQSDENFSRAPWAVVTVGDLKLNVGGLPVSQARGTVTNGVTSDTGTNSCAYWTIYSASTVNSTVEIRGGIDAASTAPLGAGAANGPKINVPVGLTPGPVRVQGYQDFTGADANFPWYLSSPIGPEVIVAMRAYSGSPVVTAVSQPMIARAIGQAAGNVTIQETQAGQFAAGEYIGLCTVPRSLSNQQDIYFSTSNYEFGSPSTSNQPIVSVNNETGLVAHFYGFEPDTTYQGAGIAYDCAYILIDSAPASGLGKITLSNIRYDVVADAALGQVQLNVFGSPRFGENGPLVAGADFNQTITNATIGTAPTLPKLNIGAYSALGLRPTTGYTTKTPKYTTVGKYVTWKFTGGTALAGQRVNVMVAKKFGGVWGGPKYFISRWADANGIVTFAWKSNTAAAINVRVQWPGSATYGVSTSAARGAYWK